MTGPEQLPHADRDVRGDIRSILVVCTGNICRSPMGEYLLRSRLAGKSLTVSSAGTGALVGAPADPDAIRVMHEHGLDLTAHRGRQLSAELLAQADLVLALDGGHRDWIVRTFPRFRQRVFKLGFWNGDADVEDPYREPFEAFVQAHAEIERHVDQWVRHLGW